jgi:GTP-binding protein
MPVQQLKLARVSQEPGKTRLIKSTPAGLSIWWTFRLRLRKGFRRCAESWGAMMEGYLSGSKELRHVFHLVDLRHAPTQDDILMVNYLRACAVPFTLIATKAAKVPKSQRPKQIALICRTVAVQLGRLSPSPR